LRLALPAVLAVAAVAILTSAMVAEDTQGRAAASSAWVTAQAAEVRVRQGAMATFRYRIASSARARPDVELRVGSGRAGVTMTVHLGRRAVGVPLAQRLPLALSPGTYVWWVALTDHGGRVSSTSAAGLLIVTGP
jgi:hypothetical protein